MLLRNTLIVTLSLSIFFACAPKKNEEESSGGAAESPQSPPSSPQNPAPTPIDEQQVTLLENFFVRTRTQGVLEAVATLPMGTVIVLAKNAQAVNDPYRLTNGQTAISPAGFYPVLRVQQVPGGYENELPPSRLAELSHLPGGLFVSGRALSLPGAFLNLGD